jgi:hypothetical protein
VLVVLAGYEDRRSGIDQPLLRPEKLIRRSKHAAAEARLLEADPAAERVRRHQGTSISAAEAQCLQSQACDPVNLLNIGAVSPAEISLSILGEITQVLHTPAKEQAA